MVSIMFSISALFICSYSVRKGTKMTHIQQEVTNPQG